MNQEKVLKQLSLKPMTKDEIAEASGLTWAQVTTTFRNLSRKGADIQKMGFGSDIHYYMPDYRQPRAVLKPFFYEELLDLIDTGEWWTNLEISEILNADRRTVSNSIRFINNKGHADITCERNDDNKFQYFVNKRF